MAFPVRETWRVGARSFGSTEELVAQLPAPSDSVQALYSFESLGAPRRALGASVGAAAGLLLAGFNVQLGAAGALIGGALGAMLAPRRREVNDVAGTLASKSAVLTFRPHNDGTRGIELKSGVQLAERLTQVEAPPTTIDEIRKMPEYGWKIPSRADQLARLKDPTQQWDIIVLGGGATGTGTALEAARRGYKVAMLEAFDFASGTSSRSTKLIHGGVRYLENAIKRLDREQYGLVKEGLHERKSFMRTAPHLTHELRLVTPCYHKWEIPYYYTGLSIYDRIAGRENLHATRILSKTRTIEKLPDIKQDGLDGAIEYSDGEFNDSRMAVGLAVTAAAHGAAVANYVRVDGLIEEDGRTVGVKLKDARTGDTWEMRGSVVVNATGPYIDQIRQMDDPTAEPLVVPSAGTHITVKNLDLPQGILVPRAPNGSVAFFKPFEGGTLIGTTEEKTPITFEPGTTVDQVAYLRDLANQYLDPAHQIQDSDITSVWTGIRPLVRDPEQPTTKGGSVSLSRKHVIEVSPHGLVTIGGGKWTSFGRMAREVVDQATASAGLAQVPTQRDSARIIGAHGFSEGLAAMLEHDYGLDREAAEHLAHNYGDRSIMVADLARSGLGARLSPDHPYLEAEVVYATRYEYAVDPVDVLSRRTRLSFVDEAAAQAALPRVAGLMAAELGWSEQETAGQLAAAQAYYARNGKTALTPPGTPGTP